MTWQKTGFIQRQRKLSGAQFAQATVFGWLQHPAATRQQLQQSLLQTGQQVTVQGLDARFSPQAVRFLRPWSRQPPSRSFTPRPSVRC